AGDLRTRHPGRHRALAGVVVPDRAGPGWESPPPECAPPARPAGPSRPPEPPARPRHHPARVCVHLSSSRTTFEFANWIRYANSKLVRVCRPGTASVGSGLRLSARDGIGATGAV